MIKRKRSVDYILDTMVYDNIKTLIRLVEEEITDQLERVIMTNRLRRVLEYLKFKYERHVGEYEDCVHSTSYALTK